jgi:hypothetical protein
VNKKSFLDMLLEALVVLVIFTGLMVILLIFGTIIANAADRGPAVLTVAAEGRDIEGICRIPAARPPQPKATPKPPVVFCTEALCRRVKAYVAPDLQVPTPKPGRD